MERVLSVLSLMTDEEVEATLDEIRDKVTDERYPNRMKIWAVVKRCDQIDADL